MPRLIFLLSLLLLVQPVRAAAAEADQLYSPQSLAAAVRRALPKVLEAVVGVDPGASGSGVIISEDGWVLSAAHGLMHTQPDEEVIIRLADGSEIKAQAKGYDLETDFTLLKLAGDRRDWPHVRLASSSVPLGGFIFTAAHPGSFLEDRPAQVRLGRVHALAHRQGKPLYHVADLEIQPGDSGGPTFNLDGELVGINSSAAAFRGFNRFPALEQFMAIRRRLEKGERFGDFEKGPCGSEGMELNLQGDMVSRLVQEFQKRMAEKHRPTLRFALGRGNPKGEVNIEPGEIVRLLSQPALSMIAGEPFGYGLYDPALMALLPKLDRDKAGCLPLLAGDQPVGQVVFLGKRRFLAKASLLPDDEAKGLKIMLDGEAVTLTKARHNKDYDIVILRSEREITELQALEWPGQAPEIEAGTPLMGRDGYGLPFWNIATDRARPVVSAISPGPIDPKFISEHRAPYPAAIAHALPLYADDSITPVYTFDGRLAGFHIARLSRTLGLMAPVEAVRHFVEKEG